MTQTRPIRVLVADDNAEIRGALAALIDRDAELELAAVAADASEAVEVAAREQPEVALIDVRMPAGGAVAAVDGIALRSPKTSMILLSASGIAPARLETKISGCIAKGIPIGQLIDAVKQAAEGRPVSVEPAETHSAPA